MLDLIFSSGRSELSTRLGLTNQAYKVPFNSSKYYNECWWTMDDDTKEVYTNDTRYVYSDAESDFAGVIYGFESLAGSILNILIIVALLRNTRLREEYLTPTIISIALTDCLFSGFFISIMSAHFFTRYTKGGVSYRSHMYY